jgi:hypothetical protein
VHLNSRTYTTLLVHSTAIEFEKVAGEAVGENRGPNRGWKIKLIILVRKGLVHELLNAQDTVEHTRRGEVDDFKIWV